MANLSRALCWLSPERWRISLRKPRSLFPLLLVACSLALPAGGQQPVGPRPRVLDRVDNGRRTVLTGQRPSILRNAADLGRLSGDTAMDHMVMLLQPSQEQSQALDTLLGQQLNKDHPNYHRWLTPQQFGAQFGVDDDDISQVVSWMASQGLRVEAVGLSKRFIQFSANVSQVESAFGIEMHRYNVGGHVHIANSADISIPTALQPVIHSVPTLNDFFKTTNFQDLGTVTLPDDASAGDGSPVGRTYFAMPGPKPNLTFGGSHYTGASDFATIYNTSPLLNSGIDGTGVTIAILGRTDINLADVQIYRTMFSLKSNDPTFVVAGEDPGIVGGDDGESYLDVEISGGVAPGASVDFVTSRSTLVTDGVDLSAMYAVQNNLGDIISFSYGQCEASVGSSEAAFYNTLWQQAAAQGQSVFVSADDSGPAGCDASGETYSTDGYAVNALASTPYNVAVGGSMFSEGSGTYWSSTTSTTPPYTSALSYIPETPWNESGADGESGLWSGGGGISAYYATPAWQRGSNVPTSDPAYPNGVKSDPSTAYVAGPHRYLPDVAANAAADHDGTVYCAEGICQFNNGGAIVNFGIVGGTSVAAPSMAGVQALVDQLNGGRQGLPNYVYYGLAAAQYTAGLNCNSSSTSINSSCVFHDVTSGNTLVCYGSATCTKKLGWTAATGYDMASGLGTPNAYQLASQWSTISFEDSSTTLGITPTTGITHGQSVTLSGSVTPTTGTGTPTGQVAFLVGSGAITDGITSSSTFNSQAAVTTLNGSGNYSVKLTTLPAGTYNVTARYGGNSTFGASTSSPVQVSVSSETSGVTIQTNSFNSTNCSEAAATSFTYGSYIWTDITVAGASGQGVPTGTVTVTDNGNPLTVGTTSALGLNANGIAHFLSGSIPSSSCIYGYTYQDVSPLTGGTHQLKATYSGNSSYGSATSSAFTVTVTPATITGALAAASTDISSGGSLQLNFTLAGLSNAGPNTLSPTGTVTFKDNTTGATLGTASLQPNSAFGSVATLTTTGITTSGAHSIVASWPGDTNYSGLTSSAVSVTVNSGTATTVTVSSSINPATVGTPPTWTATLSPTAVTSGTVNFFDSVSGVPVLLGSGTVGTGHTATFTPAVSAGLTAGTHNITAIYAGNATYASSTSAVFNQSINQEATTLQLTTKTTGLNSESFGMSAVIGITEGTVPAPSGTVTFYDGSNALNSASFTTVSTALEGYGIYQAQILATGLTVGTHTITAVLDDPNYTAPTSNSQTITVTPPKSNQTITFNPLPTPVPYGTPPFTLTASANSGLAITYVAEGYCTVSGSTVTLTGVGYCTITASQSGNANYNAASSVQQTFTITQGTQTIAFTLSPSTVAYGTANFSIASEASASSGLTVSFAVTAGSACTISGSTVHVAAVGTCTITASQSGNTDYAAATPVSQVLTVTQISQTITFSPLANKTYGAPNFTVTATASSGLAVTFAVTAGTACSISGSTVHILSAGTCTITASQSGSTDYAAATPVSQVLTVTAAGQTITFVLSPNSVAYGAADFSIASDASASSGLTVSFSATGSACTVSGSTVHITAAGTCTITASQSGGTDYSAAPNVPQTLTVTQTSQTITFTLSPNSVTYGAADFSIASDASASSGLIVSFSASGAACTISGSTVHIVSAGTCTITASQSGSTDYSAAPNVPQTLTVTQASQSITFGPLGSQTYGNPDFTVSATASSGLTVTFTASGNCTVSGTTVHLTAAGSCTITASQSGNTDYAAAPNVPQSFSIAKSNQTITFILPTTETYGSPDLTISATATSGLTVTFSVVGGSSCTLTGTTVHITAVGSCGITAAQSGNSNYTAATSVTQSFTILEANQTISFVLSPNSVAYGAADFSIASDATATSGLSVSFAVTAGVGCSVNGSTVHILAAVSCTITASQSGNANYYAAPGVSQTLTITPASQTITFGALSNQAYGTPDFTISATATSGLAVSFAATGNCTVSGNTIHLTAVGQCTITASQSGNANYSAAPNVPQSFYVTASSQTITFNPLSSQTYGNPDFTVAATASSGLTVSFAASGNCTVSGNTVHITAAGSCTITASQAGNSNYGAAPNVPQSFSIAQESQTISFSALNNQAYGAPDFTISASASSGLTVSFSASGSACTVSGSTVHITAAGTCTITASQSGGTDYSAAPNVPQTLTVTQTSQTITFTLSPNSVTYGAADFSIASDASASSGLIVSFSASGAACTISGSTVHIVSAGTCTITASQSGSTDYSAAPNVPQTLTVTQASQSITFGPLGSQTYGNPDFTVSATATSGLTISFAAAGSCTVNGNTVHLTGSGSCTITASQSGNTDYAAAPNVPQSFNITASNQTITFAALSSQTYGNPDFTISATASSGLTVSFAASGNCTVSSNTVHLTAAGSCTITASQSGNANYSAAPNVPQSFSIAQASQTIAFASLPNHPYGAPDFTVSATATSGLTVSFAASGNCTVAGSTVHLTGSGTCTITASQSGNANYSAAPSVPQSFNITSSSQTITFAPLPNQTYGAPDFTISASASSGLAVSFTASGNCTVSSNTVHITAAGSCTITASQPGNSNYGAAPNVPQSFNIAQAAQTITFASLPNLPYNSPDFTISATATSGLSVSFAATGNCTVSGNTIHLTAVGQCTITASQSGNANYSAAPSVPQSFYVTASSQTITFNPLSSQTYGNPDFTISATATSGLPVSFTASGNCTVSGNTVHITAAGSCTITASQAGNSNYGAAPNVPQSFSIAQESQTISFSALNNQAYGAPDFTISASASSGLTVSFSASGNCTVSGSTVHLTSSGSCTITASQSGNTNYAAAPSVPQSFNITASNQTITFNPLSSQTYGNPDFTISATASSGLTVSFTASGNCTVSSNTVHITAAGSCTITAAQPGNANYSAATPVARTFTVAPAGSTLSAPTGLDQVPLGVSAPITASVSGQYSGPGIAAPAGQVIFSVGDGINVSAPVNLVNGAATWSFPVNSAVAGHIYTITIAYAGDADYSAAAPITTQLEITQIQPTISWSQPASLTYGTPLGAALDAAALNGSTPVAGSYAYTATSIADPAVAVTSASSLAAGSYTLSVSFTPANPSVYKSATGSVSLIVNKATPTVALSSSVNPVLAQNPTALTATIASPVTMPTGSISFMDGSTLLGSAPLNTSGVATLSVSSLSGAGTHSLTAVYSGDTDFTSITSTPLAETVDDFNLALVTNTPGIGIVVNSNSSGSYQLTVSPVGSSTFLLPVSFSLTGLPSGATYTLTPASIPAGSGPVTLTLTVSVPAQAGALQHKTLPGGALSPVMLGLLLLPFARRLRRSAGRTLRLLALLVIFAGIGIGLTGCGGGEGLLTPYTLTFTANSGTLSHSTDLTLILR